MHAQAAVCSGCSGRAQAKLSHGQECSPSAQVKAAAAHVQTLKRNQRKKELSVTYVVVSHTKIKYCSLIGYPIFTRQHLTLLWPRRLKLPQARKEQVLHIIS
jgi:hypothetical protein